MSRAALRDRLAQELQDETADLAGLLTGLTEQQWRRPTPAQGWSVLDQVTHLAWFDDAAVLAVTDPDAFRVQRDEVLAHGADFPDVLAAQHRDRTGAECLPWFTGARSRLLDVVRAADPGVRLPWYGPDMGVASCVTARLMETWAHGQDVAEALGVVRTPTARLRSVADLGVRTLGFSFALRGLPVPEEPVRVALTGPGGDTWTWGPPECADQVRGDALEFCLLVTQRRHLADTALQVVGPVAAAWTTLAQAYAGAPGPGRPAAS